MSILTSVLFCEEPILAADKWQTLEPDYTNGEALLGKFGDENGTRYWSLGPIGADGNIWATRKDTADTRTIQIRSVMEGTPADGVLQRRDVILGVQSPRVLPDRDVVSEKDVQVDAQCRRPGCSGVRGSCGHFAWDVRKALAAAITEAEKVENGGKLVLNIWRPATESVDVQPEKALQDKALSEEQEPDEKSHKLVLKRPVTGEFMQVTITLPVLGTRGAASPWECAKTKALIDNAAQAIVRRGFFDQHPRKGRIPNEGIPAMLDALGLLATGEEKYLPVVQEYARATAKKTEGLDIMGGDQLSSWFGGYRNLLLTEYYLATKDEQVLPGLNALSTNLALGRSGVGTYSHGMAYVKYYGLYGPPSAYGAMNQCSITCIMSLALAQKCGLESKEIDDAVRLGTDFLRWYVDKGTIPYGDHPPAYNHDNNGRNSQAAVLFDLVGDTAAATYFVRQTLASYNIREIGHTGHFFASQWGALGAARGGTAAAQSFMRNMRWYTELERRPGGGSVFQRQLNTSERAYLGWSTTGQRLMQYCLPRKALYITGKGGSSLPAMTPDEVKEAAEAGRLNDSTPEINKEILDKYSVKELLAALGSWSLVVRGEAARELGRRQDNMVKELIAMLKSPNRYARYGACEGLCFAGRGSEAAIDALVRVLEGNDDLTLRYYAASAFRQARTWQPPPIRAWKYYENALTKEGGAIDKAAPALLKQAATYEPQNDPMRKLHAVIAAALFKPGETVFFPGGKGIERIDRALLIPAMKSWLINPNGATRSLVSSLYGDLSEDDLNKLWGDIYYATKVPAPSGVMAADGVRVAGVRILATYRTEEGLELGRTILAIPDHVWGTYNRLKDTIPTVKPYGQGTEEYFPVIENFIERLRKGGNKQEKLLRSIEEAYEYMKTTPEPKDLNSIRPYIDAYDDELETEEKKHLYP